MSILKNSHEISLFCQLYYDLLNVIKQTLNKIILSKVMLTDDLALIFK